MSYEWNRNDGYTESEKKLGIFSIIYGESDYHSEVKKKNEKVDVSSKNEKVDISLKEEKRRKIINKIAGSINNDVIYSEVIKLIFDDALSSLIKRYRLQVGLSLSYVEIAKLDNALEILIKSILKKYNYIMLKELTNEIDEFVSILRYNVFEDIIYDRVNSIQKFIHEKVQQKNGIDSHKKMIIKDMRNVLSACRLHLNLQDMKNMDIYKFNLLWKKNKKSMENELNNPALPEIFSGNYIPNWKYNRMSLLTDLLSPRDLNTIETINIINKKLERNKYIESIIEAYCKI